MKANKIIIWIVLSIILTSCFKENYRIFTRVDRDGSCQREIYTQADSIHDDIFFPYDLSSDWIISQTDTVIEEHLSQKNKKHMKISKKFQSIAALPNGLRSDKVFPMSKESLKKRFRWFYTYYTFTATYPELTDKGSVPMDKYLTEAEQKFYLQGKLSAYRGMSGMELKEKLDDIEVCFMNWYSHSMYGLCFDVVSYHASVTDIEFHTQLIAIKDSLYAVNKEQLAAGLGSASLDDVCELLDKYFTTAVFSTLYAEKREEMDSMLEEKTSVVNEYSKFDIRYELVLPGKILATNTDLQNNGVLAWNINLFRFLADDYTLTAESRAVNVWAFAVTLLLIVFAAYCFGKIRSI